MDVWQRQPLPGTVLTAFRVWLWSFYRTILLYSVLHRRAKWQQVQSVLIRNLDVREQCFESQAFCMCVFAKHGGECLTGTEMFITQNNSFRQALFLPHFLNYEMGLENEKQQEEPRPESRQLGSTAGLTQSAYGPGPGISPAVTWPSCCSCLRFRLFNHKLWML